MFNLITSTLASSTRFWNGTVGSKTTPQPEKTLVLYDRESCPRCRLVREALTELNLDVEIRPCPIGGSQFLNETPKGRVPYLIDPNTQKAMTRTGQILNYLFGHYGDKKVPARFSPGLINLTTSSLASTFRMNAGNSKQPAKTAAKPLTLYSFESSPYSRVVREQLSELELPYHLINLGKQQWSDMGPAAFRFSIGPYQPLPNTKRSQFFEEHGNVQVPYLEDPNTGTALFESRAIVKYLRKHYLQH